MNLFSKNIAVKKYYCCSDKSKKCKIETPYINLFITINNCNANCSFCNYRYNNESFDYEKLTNIINILNDNIKINKIGITGGEPTLDIQKFEKISNICKNSSPNTELSLNTNGYNLKEIFGESIHDLYDFISLSRHHWDDEINDKIFGYKMLTSDDIRNLSRYKKHNRQLQIKCNLIKGYVDNKESIFNFLNWANSVNITDVGFSSLSPINDYSILNKVDISLDDLQNHDNFFLTNKILHHKNGCQCSNYIFLPENLDIPMRIYHKDTGNPDSIEGILTFDGKSLKIGFNGDVIY